MAVGPGTAAALKKYGLTADYVPAVYSAQDLGLGIPATGTVLLPRAQEGSPLLTQALTQRGIPYEELAVYTTHYDNPRSPELREALEQRPVRQAPGKVYGLLNVHARIRMTYKEDYGLTIESRPERGTVVCLRIPAREQKMTADQTGRSAIENIVCR